MQQKSQQWLTVNQVAEYTRVSRFTIYRWSRNKKITIKVLPNGRKLIRKYSLGLSDSERWFTINEAAEYVEVPRHTINAWIRKKNLYFEKNPSGLKRIKREDLLKLKKYQ